MILPLHAKSKSYIQYFILIFITAIFLWIKGGVYKGTSNNNNTFMIPCNKSSSDLSEAELQPTSLIMAYTYQQNAYPARSQQSPLPPYSIESSEESYKDKFENVRLIVQQLQRDLQSERLRNEGIKTISVCLEEERTENQHLRDQQRKLERGITILQSRIQQYGGDTTLSLQEGELLLPGPSKSLMDNLMSENSRLQQQLKHCDINPEEVEQLKQELSNLKDQLEYERKQKEEYKSKHEKVEILLTQSKDGKDQEILRLEEEVTRLRQSKDTQNIICQSLTDQTQSLRSQLQDTMRQMQQLMASMDVEQTSQQQQHQQLPDIKEMEIQELKKENDTLKQTVSQQEEKLKEVIDMNARWQTFNKQRDQHVTKLKRQLTEAAASPPAASMAQTQEEVDKTILSYKRKVALVEEEKQQVEDENRQLRQQISHLQREVTEKQTVIDDLKNKPAAGLDKEKIHLYESQIKVITEDFLQEREDRTREHQKVQALQEELTRVKAQLESLQRTRMDDFSNQRQRSLENYEQQYRQNAFSGAARRRNIGVPQAGYVARGTPLRYECDGTEEQRSEDVVDMPQRATDTVEADCADEQADDMLQCPKCNKAFPSEKHTDLLEHLDICCG